MLFEVVQVISTVLKACLKAKSAALGSPARISSSGHVAAVWERLSLLRKMRGASGDRFRPVFAPHKVYAKNIRHSPQNSSSLKICAWHLLVVAQMIASRKGRMIALHSGSTASVKEF
jgi:hypothetical protein